MPIMTSERDGTEEGITLALMRGSTNGIVVYATTRVTNIGLLGQDGLLTHQEYLPNLQSCHPSSKGVDDFLGRRQQLSSRRVAYLFIGS